MNALTVVHSDVPAPLMSDKARRESTKSLVRALMRTTRKIDEFEAPKGKRRQLGQVASALENAALCFTASLERGSPTADKDFKEGQAHLKRAMELAGSETWIVPVISQVKALAPEATEPVKMLEVSHGA